MLKKKKIKKPENQEEQWRTPKKRMKNQGVFHSEPKSAKIHLALTPSSKKKLQEVAKIAKLSVSEYMEQWVRSL